VVLTGLDSDKLDRIRITGLPSTYLTIDERRQRQVVKEIGEILPDVGVAVLAQTLVIEAVDLCDLTTLMVTTQDCDPVFEPHLT